MEKEFVSYEQALALKELGFDEPCLGYYTHNTGVEMNKLALTRHPKRNINSDINWVNKLYEGDVTAPLKQQVFRWFRENYDIDYYISKKLPDIGSKFSDGRFAYSVVINKTYYPFLTRDNYEEAENACIDKLIEIVKTYES